jgi:peptide/nickel transport system substrate-binding protein
MRLMLVAAALLFPLAAIDAKDLRVGIAQDALTLDPANHRSRDTETIIRNMAATSGR